MTIPLFLYCMCLLYIIAFAGYGHATYLGVAAVCFIEFVVFTWWIDILARREEQMRAEIRDDERW